MAMLAIGGIYPCPELISDILKPEPAVQKSILDLGVFRFNAHIACSLALLTFLRLWHGRLVRSTHPNQLAFKLLIR